MSFKRWELNFEGAYNSPDPLEARPGVYVIWCKIGENWSVLDVGEAEDVKERVTNHDRADCWSKNCSGAIYYSATYTPDLKKPGRIYIEKTIRDKEKPPCGER